MTALPAQPWFYRAKLIRLIDGDTLIVELDQGLHTYRVERLRLLRCNAPEIHGATKMAGLAATAYTTAWLAAAGSDPWPLTIETYRTDDFGRYLAEVWRLADGANLSDDLLSSGNATAFMTGSP
jgi:micrococcal nuclease